MKIDFLALLIQTTNTVCQVKNYIQSKKEFYTCLIHDPFIKSPEKGNLRQIIN